MMERNTINNDDTYRDTEGCAGCIVSVVAVVIIFAIAAGLWLFSRS